MVTRDKELATAAAHVDVLDVAGRMIANPDRAMVSRAAVLAMALTLERCWEVCIEALTLVHALEMAMPWAETDDGGEQAERVALQAAHVRDLMAAITQTPKETDDGKSQG